MLDPLTHSDVWLALGWTMIHFLWAGALITAVAAVTRRLLRGALPEVRYLAALLGQVALVAAAVWIFSYELTDQKAGPPAGFAAVRAHEPYPGSESAGREGEEMEPASAGASGAVSGSTVPLLKAGKMPASPPAGANRRFEAWLSAVVSYLPWVWACGTSAFLGVLTFGLLGIVRLRASSRRLDDGPATALCAQLRQTTGLLRRVGLATSDRILSPCVLGMIQPVVLLPAGAVAKLTPEQLEMVLLHELAHIRRWDNAINVLQRLLEAVLFFHPGIWWSTRWVGYEQENCCDEFVLHRQHPRRAYAELLASFCGQGPYLAGAVAGLGDGDVVARIRTILHADARRATAARVAAGGAASLLLVCGLVIGLAARASLADEYRVRSAPRNAPRPAAPTSRPVIPPQRNPRVRPETFTELLYAKPDATFAEIEPFLAGDPNRSERKDGDDPLLMVAIQRKREDVARVLIQRGASINWTPKYDSSWTPICAACSRGLSLDFIKYLISKGAKLEPNGKDKRTLLHFAAMGGKVEVARFLISKGFDVNGSHPSEGTPLNEAVSGDQIEMSRFLIQQGSKIGYRDEMKRTVLHWAAIRGNAKMAEMLMANGAEVNARDKYRRTALTIAADADHKDTIAVLKKHGATE